MPIAQRSKFPAKIAAKVIAWRALLPIGLAVTLLGGCFAHTDRAPVRYPVDGEPEHIFADPIGFHYPDMVVHRSPLLSPPVVRDIRPNYPTYDPATGVGTPPVTPAAKPGTRPPVKVPATPPALPDPSKPFELPKPVDPAAAPGAKSGETRPQPDASPLRRTSLRPARDRGLPAAAAPAPVAVAPAAVTPQDTEPLPNVDVVRPADTEARARISARRAPAN